jgi:ribosomal-protein-alanine N-acetyltransferase
MFFIESERLRLIPLTHQLLQLCNTNRAAMELTVGLNISSMQIDELYTNECADAMLNFWLPKTLEFPERYEWYTTWDIIKKETNTTIGGIGFIGYPNEAGETEIGYMLDKQEHGNGYAPEALQTLVKWAFSHEDVKCIIVHTFEGNLPSRKMLVKCGFDEVGKDEEGLMTFRLSAPSSEP